MDPVESRARHRRGHRRQLLSTRSSAPAVETAQHKEGNKPINSPFEKKSIWIELLGVVVAMGGYLVVAGSMIATGATRVAPFAPVFAAAVVVLVIALALGHTIAAAAGYAHKRNEHDRLIAWRSASGASWILAVGILLCLVAMVLSVDNARIANGLVLTLFLAQVTRYVLQLVHHRRSAARR